MVYQTVAKISTVAIFALSQFNQPPAIPEMVLSSHEISLKNRYSVKSVSDIFKDNILLNLAYMDGRVKKKEDINWDEIKKPLSLQFSLGPGKTFAFHEDILDEYKNTLVKTTQAHFNSSEGFKTDGYLFGDGVCHLASLIYWVAKDARLDTKAPTNHDFMAIPEIDKQYGVSIYSNPFSKGSYQMQNLYVTNNKQKPIIFRFDYNGEKLKASVVEEN